MDPSDSEKGGLWVAAGAQLGDWGPVWRHFSRKPQSLAPRHVQAPLEVTGLGLGMGCGGWASWRVLVFWCFGGLGVMGFCVLVSPDALLILCPGWRGWVSFCCCTGRILLHLPRRRCSHELKVR